MLEDWAVFRSVLPEAGIKIGVALICGFLLGMEREMKEKPAGLRTLILITVGSTVFMIVSDLIAVVTEGPDNITRVDTSRVASQVVTGIGFLGAGAIIQSRGSIRGLTTAAAIWVASGVGLVIGVGFPLMAVAITLIVLLVLVLLNPIGNWFSRRGHSQSLDLVIPNDSLVLRRLQNILAGSAVREEDIHISDRNEDALTVSFLYRAKRGKSKEHLFEELSSIEGIRGAEVSP